MSRAFVNEDAGDAGEPEFRLPDPDSPAYEEAAAWALIQGADEGDSRSAEKVRRTGGSPSVVRRFLRAAGVR